MKKLFCLYFIFFIPYFAQTQSVGFTYTNSTGAAICNPATINFTQTCTGSPIGFTWSFGNGQTSNAPNPSVIFATGTYNVKLTAIFDGQVLETTQTITVNPAIAVTLAADRTYICTAGNINFTAISTGTISTYEWAFGDGATLITNNATTSHLYSNIGNYTAIVRAVAASGCTANSPITISLQNPSISAFINPTNGCAPLVANFNANVNVPSGSTVTNYNWAFGDVSPPANTTTNTTTHPYADSGTYSPTVSITTSEGCINSFAFANIAYGIPPIDHVAYPKKNVYCGSETTMLVAKATYANAYRWAYGDGIIETVTDTLTSHKYATLGTKTITVTPFFNGCAGSPLTFNINIVGVIASFNFANTCIDKKTFTFTNTSTGILNSSTWSYGDGTPNASSFNTSHTFPASGAYPVQLIVANTATGCSDTITNAIYTANPTLVNVDTFVCRNSSTTFTLLNNYINGNVAYNWHVLGLPVIANNLNPFSVIATNFGSYASNYVAINVGTQYCNDTIRLLHSITVRGPNLNFTSPTEVCANERVIITNNSSANTASDTVKLWYWNYGQTNTNDTSYRAATVRYTVPGTYAIKLVAKDNKGCTDSLQKSILVKAIPFLRVFPRADTVCLGASDSLFAFHSDTLLWSPASLLSCSNCDTTVATPNASTIFYATATNSLGCSVTDSSIVTVFSPFTATILPSPISGCIGDSVRLAALPTNKKISWSPSLGLSATDVYNPWVYITNNTNYVALLQDSANCFTSSATVNVIAQPLPTVNAGANIVVPYNTSFTIAPQYSSNVIIYQWLPTTNLNCNTCSITTGTALNTQTYIIKATSNNGCVAKDTLTVFVECKNANLFVPNAFTPNTDGLNDVFYAQTRGIKTIKLFEVYNRYGQKLFSVKNGLPNNKQFGWDGSWNGIPQLPDSYVYILEVICDLGENISKKASFLLLK